MADDLPLPQQYIDAIKRFEGYQRDAKWDYKQYSVGYGSKARYPGEKLSQQGAHDRLIYDLKNAADTIDSKYPNLPAGPRAALIDLTHNAGSGWITSGLGKAVNSGDWSSAQQLLQQYNRAGGQVLPSLADRRGETASWMAGNEPTLGEAPSSQPTNYSAMVDYAHQAAQQQQNRQQQEPWRWINFFAGPVSQI
jgi:lysozyme